MESHNTLARKGCLGGDLARLLASSLNCQLLGIEMTATLYACNGFRFLGIPACAPEVVVASAAQKFRNLFRLDFSLALKSCVQTGYDASIRLAEDDVRECLARLQEPRYRLLYEVFWPHVSDESFHALTSQSTLGAPEVIQHLTAMTRYSDRSAALFAIHALAITYHNQAIAHELAFSSGTTEWTELLWVKALTYWAKIIAAEDFWAYLRQRVIDRDDPRVKPDDVEEVRTRLPAVLLGFHALFALAYDRVGEVTACDRHLALIHPSTFSAAACAEVLSTTVRMLTERRIKPLIQGAESELLNATGKVSRQQFTKSCAALLDGAFAICHSLVHDLHLPASLVARMQFDGLCDCVLRAINHKLNYDTEDRLRSVLSGSLVVKKLLQLPLSSFMRTTLEQALHSDTKLLYKDFLASPYEVDPTMCWFLDGEDADPDASIELPVYKITRREVQVHYQTGTASISVGYNAQCILVPRSVKARASHAGHPSIPAATLAAHQQDLQRLAQEETAQIAQQRTQRDAAIAAERVICRQRQQDYLQQQATEVAAAQQQMTAEQTMRARALQQEEARYAAAGQQHTAERDSRLAAPQALLARMHGLHGWYRLECPLLLCTGLLMVSLRGLLSLPDSLGYVAIGVIPVVSALLLGAGVRCVVRWRGRQRIHAITGQYDTQAQQMHQQHCSHKDAVECHFQEAIEPARQTLAGVAEHCKHIEHQSVAQIARFESTSNEAIAHITQHTQQQVAASQEQFRQQYEARPETTVAKFPIYCHAKAAGYQDGVEPSTREREMTNAERDEARRRFETSRSAQEGGWI